ncbi:MAG: AAA family ATPase [Ignavibacteriaceae bacterium]|nr:AAA family ATPase [Ignavibacteriaceae bacterium]
MEVKKLELKNFRGFGHFEISFQSGMNLLIGENGSGKTTLLEALSIGLSAFFLGIRSQKTRSIAKNDIRVLPFGKNGTVNTEPQIPVEISLSCEWNGQELEWKRYRETTFGKTKNDAKLLQTITGKLDDEVRNGKEIILPLLCYYGNGRLWLEPKKTANRNKKIFSRFDGYSLCLDPRKSISDIEEWFRRQEHSFFKEGIEPLHYSIVKKSVLDALPGFSEIGYDPKGNQIYIVKNNGTKLPYSGLSDGQRGVLALVGDLAIRIVTLNPSAGEEVLSLTSGVVLIDELDLYLHPKWQRVIASVLQKIFPKIQFICTTHSPQVIGEIEGDKIYSLDLGNNLTEAYGLDSNTILEDVMASIPRSESIYSKYEKLEILISEEKFTEAEALIQEITLLIKGVDSSLNRLITIMNNLKALNSAD